MKVTRGRRRNLEAVVLFAESVLVEIASLFGDEFGIVDVNSGSIPIFHRNHRVIIAGESLFSTDGVNPGVDGLFVVIQQLIEVYIFHLRVTIGFATS
jgi:hypothetical protein